ncbi:MAG: hypothetical protein P4L22_06890 [Candidatus Babeliales bacterium]|nr:hypothetical protein [Candidatus Babeliales bacterium]
MKKLIMIALSFLLLSSVGLFFHYHAHINTAEACNTQQKNQK